MASATMSLNQEAAQAPVRAAGAFLDRFWGHISYTPFWFAAALLGAGMLAGGAVWKSWQEVPTEVRAGALALLAGTTGAMLLGGWAMEGCELARRRALYRRFAALPREERAAVLLPLRSEAGETGRLAARLLRDLRVPCEVTPSAAPAGGRSEVCTSVQRTE